MSTEFLNPEQILDKLDLSPNMIAADFGSGSGGWSLPLAKRLSEGKIFAIDILREPLSALEGKAKSSKILNIQTILSDIEKENGSKLGDNSVDLVLMTNLLFQVEKRERVLREAKRILKNGGKVLIVDWLPKASVGPEKGRIMPETLKKMAQEIGFSLEGEFKAGAHHYGIILGK